METDIHHMDMHGKNAYFYDPDGHEVELIEYTSEG